MENGSTGASTPSPGMEALELPECRSLLARHRLCTMSVVDGDEPYGVPLYYGFDGRTMHLGLAEGRKTRAIDANPRVCITVSEIGAGDAWASVLVSGIAEWVEGPDREESMRVLIEHNRRVRLLHDPAAAAAPPAPRRQGAGRILRVRDPIITGRARR